MPTPETTPTVNSDELADAVILGAGISGLVAASILTEKGFDKIHILDRYPSVGGNHIDVAIGPYTFDIGSLIFQDDSPLLKHFPELLPFYVHITPTWSRLNPQHRITAYPISIKDDVVAAGPIEWTRMGLSVLWARAFCRKLNNARDFARYWVGAHFFRRSGLENYMERFYGLRAEEIDLKFAEKRMLWIKYNASIEKLIFAPRKVAQSPPTNRQLARPREGFGYLYQVAKEKLERKGVKFHLNVSPLSIEKIDGGFTITSTAETISAKRLISTLPLEDTLRLCGLSQKPDLRTVTLITLFYSFAGDRKFDASILYNFSYDGYWKRLTVYSDFYGLAEGREFFAVEVNGDLAKGDIEIAHQNFLNHTRENRLFDGSLILEGSHIISNAYPIYSEGADALASEVVAELKRFGIESIGRQGRFDYQPTARDTTLKAEYALRDLV